MRQDLIYAFRLLGKSPGFTAVAILTLALGIGANTAIFSVFRHVLLNSLPYPDSNRIVTIWLQDPEHNFPKDIMSYGRFEDTRNLKTALASTAALTESTFVLRADEPELLRGAVVSADFFTVMGVPAKLGHSFDSDADEPGKDQVIVLSHGLWARRFGANPAVLGTRIGLNSRTYTVIGVMPSSFEYPRKVEFWIPLTALPQLRGARGPLRYACVARLKNGVSAERAKAELDALNRSLGEKFPQTDKRAGTTVNLLRDELTEDVKAPLVLMFYAVGCVLLIACANVASMMMARAAGRNREMKLRIALGAKPFRIVRQLVTESVVLFTIGGLAGLMLSVFAVALLVRLAPFNLGDLRTVHVDFPVALFALGVAAGTGVLFGLTPAISTLRHGLHDALKQRGAATGGQRFRHVMVMSQIAVAIVLLSASGLLIRSFLKLERLQLGFEPDHLLTFQVTVPASKYAGAKMGQFFTVLTDRLRRMPGVQSAAATSALLLGEIPVATGRFIVEGRAERGGLVEEPVAQTYITPGFFPAFGQRLLGGRDFNHFDGPDAPAVTIINERMAKRIWPNENPIGKRFRFGFLQDNTTWLTVVGIAADTRRRGLDKDVWLESYGPIAQQAMRGMNFIVRARGDPLLLVTAIRAEVRALDRDQPIASAAMMNQLLDDRLAPRRFHMVLLIVVSAVALVLASVGLYGVLAYLVMLRTQEIGVRMALGANSSDVLRLISWRSAKLVLGGILAGVPIALAATRWMVSLLYGVAPHDPLTLTIAAASITIAAAAASFFPARRALRVDPMVALRHD